MTPVAAKVTARTNGDFAIGVPAGSGADAGNESGAEQREHDGEAEDGDGRDRPPGPSAGLLSSPSIVTCGVGFNGREYPEIAFRIP